MELIAKGAEAQIYRDGDVIIKVRNEKKYRNESLDASLRRGRTKKEGTALRKCYEAGIPCPELIAVEGDSIRMSIIPGERMSETFNGLTQKEKDKCAGMIGRMLAGMHSIGLCHGDLAPTNIIIYRGKPHVIDFGLCEFTTYHEKMAADIAVMHKSLGDGQTFKSLLDGYIEGYKEAGQVIARWKRNCERGRYKKGKRQK